jgi:hypothetical protein
MSEDVKPRIWKAISIEWRKDSLVRMVTTFKEEGLPVIELEPTMRMMDEMTKKLEELENYLNFRTDDLVGDDLIGDKRHTIRFNSLLESINKTLEKYKKFKEGLR